MKRFIFLGWCFLYSYNASSQSNKGFRIVGKADSVDEGTQMYLIYNEHIDTIALTKVHKGTFYFSGKLVASPMWASLRIKGQKTWLTFLLENAKIKVHGTVGGWGQAKVIGSASNDEWVDYMATVFSKENLAPFDSLSKATAVASSHNDTALLTILEQIRRNDMAKFYNGELRFFDQHLNSTYIPWPIKESRTLSLKQKEQEYDKLTPSVKASNYGVELKQKIDKDKITNSIKVGGVAPDFYSITPAGDSLSLKEVVGKGKLTLIDFWASWCVPCRKETPNLRRVYAAFHGKGLNILSIAFDDNRSSWLKAIEKDSMQWFNASELKSRNEDAGQLYGIDGIPASILIDSTGRIIAIDAGLAKIPSEDGSLRGQNLFNKINDILGK